MASTIRDSFGALRAMHRDHGCEVVVASVRLRQVQAAIDYEKRVP